MFRQKGIQRNGPICDPIQIGFPQRRCVRICDFVRQHGYDHTPQLSRNKIFLLRGDGARLFQSLDNPGSCSLCPDSFALLETCCKLLILDIFMDFLHCLEQGRVGKTLWRCCNFLFDHSVVISYDITFCDCWKHRSFFTVFIRILFILLVNFLPAHCQDRFSVPDEFLIRTRDDDFGRLVCMDGIELGKIGFYHEQIEFLLLIR